MKRIVLACTLCLGSATAMAEDFGFYFDAALGQSALKDLSKSDFDSALNASIQSSTFDDKGSFWSVAAGYKACSYFAADLGFAELGAAKYRANITASGVPLLYKASLSSSGPTLAAMGILPIGSRFEIHGRGGLLFAKTSFKEYATDNTTSSSYAYSAKSRDFFFGVEAAFNITQNIAAHVGAQRFLNVGDKYETGESDIDVFSLGVTFKQ